jgi:rsbT co-antagonist protein RsbR
MQQRIARLLTVRSQDEDERQRGSMVIMIALGLIITDFLLLPLTLQANASMIGRIVLLGSVVVDLIALFLARSGRVTFGALTLLTLMLVGIFSPMIFNGTVSFSIFYLALSLLIASLTLRPWQIWLILLAIFVGITLLVTVMPISPWIDPTSRNMLFGGVIFLGIVTLISYLGASSMARALRNVRQARTQVEASAADLARSNIQLEERISERTAALQTALTEVENRAEEQARLLAENEQQRSTIREMSVPVIPVSDTTMVIPLIGTLDSERLAQLCEQALQSIERARTRYLVLDITGVVIVDSQVAQGIIMVVQSARLLGTEVILVGIRPEVAQAVVQLGLNLEGMRAFSTLHAALNGINARHSNMRAVVLPQSQPAGRIAVSE